MLPCRTRATLLIRRKRLLNIVFTVSYGPHPDQVGDCYLPAVLDAPTICLLHGGFWRMPYGRDQLHPLASALADLGWAVWNIGYRRVGPGGSAWPATFEDVGAALRFLPQLQRQHPIVRLQKVLLLGHSAGGHLAFWAAAEAQRLGLPHGIAGVVGLAPILDLELAYRTDMGAGAVAELVGGSPETVPARYAESSPIARLPLGIPQWILHGELDTAVRPAMSRAYAAAAHLSGDQVTYGELRGLEHMALIDPGSPAFDILCNYLSVA